MKKLMFVISLNLLIIFAIACEKDHIQVQNPEPEPIKECWECGFYNLIVQHHEIRVFCDKSELGYASSGFITEEDIRNYERLRKSSYLIVICKSVKAINK